jgi:uncharacterized YccA/Bax inhibitor family protein
MESSNPMLSRIVKAAGTRTTGATMTVAGTAWKTLVLLALVCFGAAFTWQAVAAGNTGVLMPALLVGGIGGLVLALVTSFVPRLAPITAPLYAVVEGLALGAISALYDARYAGLPRTAVVLTLATAGGMYLLYATGVIRATPMFRRIVVGATLGIVLASLVAFVARLFGAQLPFLWDSSPLGIGISVVIVGVAALNLVLDFDFIEQGARHGAPRSVEWFGAFGLTVTLVWLYLELLRLLSRLSRR